MPSYAFDRLNSYCGGNICYGSCRIWGFKMSEELIKKYRDKLNKIFKSMKNEQVDLMTYLMISHKFAATAIANVLANIPDHAHVGALSEIMSAAEERVKEFKKNLTKN